MAPYFCMPKEIGMNINIVSNFLNILGISKPTLIIVSQFIKSYDFYLCNSQILYSLNVSVLHTQNIKSQLTS